MMDVSIILPSHNGSSTLPRVFKALASLDCNEISVEYILVDNASDDNTNELMVDFLRDQVGVCLTEARKGKSYALNSAIRAATGKLLIFVDDDIIPDAAWLEAYVLAARQMPSVALFAGALRPDWPQPPSSWQENLAARGRSFGCTDERIGDEPCSPDLVKGGNFAVRASDISGLTFDEAAANFGAAEATGGGEDTLFASRILENGGTIWHVPGAIAKHIVRRHEMTVRSIAERYRRIGRGVAARSQSWSMWFALPFSLAGFAALCLLAWLAGSRNFAALQLTRAASRLGRLEYAIGKLRG